MKWLRQSVLTATLFALTLLAQSSYATCNPCYFKQRVKLPKQSYQHYALDGINWVYQATCKITAFKPETRSVVISPLSSDPNVKTAKPLSRNACYRTLASNGQMVGEYFLKFKSLKDLGTWTVTCDGQHIDPSYCYIGNAPPCNIICNPAYATAFMTPIVNHVTVYNNPPTANISHTPTPAWNKTLTLKANAKDADHPSGGSFTYRWSIKNKPSASTTTLSDNKAANPKLAFSSDKDIGTWKLQLHVDDDKGERKTFTHSFTVPNVKPDIKITGGSVDALQKLTLSASPTKDPDGGDLSFTWRVVTSPPKAQYALNHTWKTPSVSFATKEGDIGDWEFECVAEDNEKDKDTETTPLTVRNLKPEIKFKGQQEIDIGDTIKVETTVLKDKDGGDLDFAWDIVQVPQNATPNVKKNYYTGSGTVYTALFIPTSKDVSYAGTWIVKLTAKDNDNAKDSSVSKEYAVVVDAPPTAAIQGPFQAQTKDFPIELKGDGSEDPDSPCVGTSHRCHKRLDGKAAQKISDGISTYTWSVLDVPSKYWGQIFPGRVDNVLNVPAIGDKLKLQYTDLKPGDWTFQLQVKDKEGNTDSTTHALKVIETNTPPVATLNGPARYTTDAFGFLSQDIVLSGKNSYDLDELLKPNIASIMLGMGISQYAWQILSAPPGCTPPTLASGPTNHTVTLYAYASGSTVPAACQGHWTIQLTVTDNDTPAKTASAQTTVIIGNCPQPLCIDYPTQAKPSLVDLTESTDVIVYYHLDSSLYTSPLLSYGLFTRMDLFHESDLAKPVRTSFDANVLASNKGGMPIFHWMGYNNKGLRAQEGKYTVQINLVDHLLAKTGHAVTEKNAIWIRVAELSILPASDKYVSYDKLDKKADQVSLSYKMQGSAKVDELLWKVMDDKSFMVHQGKLAGGAGGAGGTIGWDGQVGGKTILPGYYTVLLEAYKAGALLGKSQPHSFAVYRITMEPMTGPLPGTPPSQIVHLNDDDDNGNSQLDKDEVSAVAGENDLVELKVKFEPALPPYESSVTLASGANALKLWTKADKQAPVALNADLGLAANVTSHTLFVEGHSVGKAKLAWLIKDTTGSELDRAEIGITVTKLDIDVNGDHSGDIAQYLPGYNLADAPQGNQVSLLQDLDIVLVGAANLTNLTVELSAADTTSHKGFAGNGPTIGVYAAGQKDFVLRKNNADGTTFSGLSTDANGVIQGVKLRCRDYGGKTKVIVKQAKSPAYELSVPLDRDADDLADVCEKKQLLRWRTQYGLGAAFDINKLGFFDKNSNKEEKDPDGVAGFEAQVLEGDPTNAFVEYRGFLLSGGGFNELRTNGHPGGHKRLDFARKEFLVEIDLRNTLTPPGGSTANILNDGTKVWSQALQGCGIWVYYVMDETALNFGAADAQINTKVKAVDFLKQHRNPRLKKYFVHMIIGENTPAWGTGSGRGYSFIGEADKDKRGIYMFFQPASAVPTQGGYMKVFAHELMHLMYNNTTGDWDAGSHLIDPDGDGHLYKITPPGWVGDPAGPPHGPDAYDQRVLMWRVSHASQENLKTVTICPKTQKVIKLKNNPGVNP